MNYLHYLLDAIILIVLVIPIIKGFRRGLVEMILSFGKFLLSSIFACLLCKPMGVWLRDRWVYRSVHKKLENLIAGEVESGATIGNIAEKLPEGLQKSLSAFDIDASQIAGELAETSESAIADFTEKVSGYVANIASVVLGFAILFVVGLILFFVVGKLLNAVVTRLPVIKTINTLLGGVLGTLMGIGFAWGVSRILVAVLGFFAMVDYTDAILLNFFHNVNPLGWVFALVVSGLQDITLL